MQPMYSAPPPDQPGMAPIGPTSEAQLASLAKDIEASNSPAHFIRGSLSKLPNSNGSKQKTNVPLGIVLQPLAPPPPGVPDVPSVNFGTVGTIVRCRSCRTYINPFVTWESNGRRWTCNLCGESQLTPDTYMSPLDETGKRADRFDRPELHQGAVEYIAPGEYMVRPPQPPVFMFLIDVSYTSVVTHMLDTVVASIKEAIQSGSIPGGSRTMMGIITFDTSLHFYNLNSNLTHPQMLVVSDLEDLFLPLPDDILVNAQESESAILTLLDSLPQIFAETRINESCLGSAVKGAYLAMKHIGGKMLVFGACIPSVGENSLKTTRDQPRLLGTDREVELLRPVGDGYKDLATELTRAQITAELFMAPQAYIDLASIAPLAKNTGGDIRYYPQFHMSHSGMKFKSEVLHCLTRYQGWEAVMRIRVSRGWKITKFYGHFLIKGTDLLVVPNCHADQTFAVAIDMEENVMPDPVLCVQSALLYTNCEGERRIRVHTWAAITTQYMPDIINSVDVQATIALLNHAAAEHSLKENLPAGRTKINSQCQQIVLTGNTVPSADAAQFLPLYILGMLKSAAYRPGNELSADMRTYIWARLQTVSVSQMAAYFYPRLLALHNLAGNVGSHDENGHVVLPDMMNLTSEVLSHDGVYLLEDGDSICMWIGRGVDTNFLQACFGVGTIDQLDVSTAEANMSSRSDQLATKIWGIIGQVRRDRTLPYMNLNVIVQGDPKETKLFFSSLIEDKTTPGVQYTYQEFLNRMGYRPQAAQQQAAPAPGTPAAAPAAGYPQGCGAMAPPTLAAGMAPPMGGGGMHGAPPRG